MSLPAAGVAAQYLYVSGTGIYVTGDPAALQSQLGADATLTAVVSVVSRLRLWKLLTELRAAGPLLQRPGHGRVLNAHGDAFRSRVERSLSRSRVELRRRSAVEGC